MYNFSIAPVFSIRFVLNKNSRLLELIERPSYMTMQQFQDGRAANLEFQSVIIIQSLIEIMDYGKDGF